MNPMLLLVAQKAKRRRGGRQAFTLMRLRNLGLTGTRINSN
jgi:hypothetical protein